MIYYDYREGLNDFSSFTEATEDVDVAFFETLLITFLTV